MSLFYFGNFNVLLEYGNIYIVLFFVWEKYNIILRKIYIVDVVLYLCSNNMC